MSPPAIPACTVEAAYWREGLRWKVVLQAMYWTSAPERAAGSGPYFVVGRVWRESTAKSKVAEIEDRLRVSREKVARWMLRPTTPVPVTYPSGGGES